MACPSCGSAVLAGQRFCANCGTALERACPSCATPYADGQRFCANCGTALAGAPGTTGVTGASTSSGGHDEDAGPIAERRLVSVLFADLVGFTPFAEERDAEDTREMLGRYADLSRELIGRYGGVVEKFIGDAVMAVWGAPVAREDDAERAVRAALELIDAIPSLGPGIQARAGVLTGEAAINIGAVNQGLVVGDIVNTAARLQSAAQPGTVLVGEATMRAASSAIAFEQAGEQVLKGKSAPVPAWRALRVVAQRGGQGRSDLPEPPFVGRQEELRQLKDLIATTGRDRRTRLASITGPAGIGKSRLAWELEKYIDGISETIFWHRGRSPSYGEGVTFWALGEMVRRRAGLSESDDAETTRRGVAATVAEYVATDDDRRWVEPALLTLLGLEAAPPGGRDVLFAAWRIFFEQVANRGTTILLFEDLHWADSGMLDFIEHLLEWARNVPILVVTLARPELLDRRPGWGSTTRHLTKMPLEPLDDEAMSELLAGFVPGLPATAMATILRRADGIPLYAVETIRSLVADGRLAREGDVYRPVGELGDLAIPETLRSLIASRLDGLDAVDHSLIADASVVGQSFTLASLAAVSGQAEDEVDRRLRGLVRRELLDLEIDPRSPERGQYRFVQSLIREVAYGTLARRERRARHLAAARYFEASADDELAGLLASHYVAAHEASTPGPEADAVAIQARIALSGAAERAATLGAHDQAVSYLRQAIEITADDSDRIELLLRAAASADVAARGEDAEAFVRSALDLARGRADRSATGRAEALLGEVLINRGLTTEAMAFLASAVDLLDDSDDAEARASLLANLSRAQMREAKSAEAIATADLALDLAEHLGLDRIVAEAFNNKGSSLGYLGRKREGKALLQAAVDLAHERGFVAAEIRAMSNLGASDEDFFFARRTVRASEALARKVGNRGMANWAAGSARYFDAAIGDRWDEALREGEEAAREAAEAGGASALDEIRTLSIMGWILVARGAPTEEILARLDVLARQVSDPYGRAAADFLRGDRAFMEGEYAVAYDHIATAAAGGGGVETFFLPHAVRAALWLGDSQRARALGDRIDALGPTDGPSLANRSALAAGIAALEGRTDDAISGYRAALAAMSAMGLRYDLARTELDFVKLVGPASAVTQEAATEARQTFESLRATAWLALLDDVLAGASSTGPAGRTAPIPVQAAER